MSNPARLQQRSPFRTQVRVRRNFPVLPPIGQVTPTPLPLSKVPSVIESTRSSLSIQNVEVECETPTEDPRDFWIRLHEHLDNELTENRTNHGNQRTLNKVVRIFVSSTFTDFFNEREVLIKKVFPELRDQMEPLGIQIIDCDLRWGVPKDSTSEQTILTCMEELDRCIEDNGQPFFIGLVSDKYGWVPKMNSLPKHLVERYRWIDGASITLMEFLHGAFRTRNPNALFLIRNSENISKHIPERYLDKFRDRDQFNQRQVEELKIQIPKMFPPEQILHYDCFYNGLDSSTGRERVVISGLETFQNHAKKFLFEAIEKWYEEEFQGQNKTNTEHQQMMNFLLNKIQLYIECPKEIFTLKTFVSGDHEDLKLIEGENQPISNHRPLMALIGQPGAGKTMTLAKFALEIENEMQNQCLLFYYFLDGAFQDNASFLMSSKLCRDLNKYLQENNIVWPETGLPLTLNDEKFISRAISLISIPIILILDGLDKGDIHQRRRYFNEFPFSSLSELLSDHTFIIVSCQLNSSLHGTIKYYSHYECQFENWNSEQRRSFIELFFRRFNKVLEPEQKTLLIENLGGENPFYLSCVCENLRQFGDYSLVTQRLKNYPHNMDELFKFLIDEAYALVDDRTILDAFFKFLLVSEVGLLETDVVNLLHYHFNENVDEEHQTLINPMIWSICRRYIKTFLDTTWIYGNQLIVFRHSSIEKLLQNRLFKEDDVEEKRPLHRCLGDFYMKKSSVKQFAYSRVPFHLEQAQMYKEMVDFLRSDRSRPVESVERRAYLQRRRCPSLLHSNDGVMNQRAYICNICALQFKMGPYTMAKSSCAVCTNIIHGVLVGDDSSFKREARLCQKHGYPAYPLTIQCFLCRTIRPKQIGPTPMVGDPVALHICFQCWIAGRGSNRCCMLETK